MVDEKPVPPLSRTIKIAIALFLLDAFFLNQGVVALAAVAIGLPVTVLRAFLTTRRPDVRRRRLSSAGIYVLMAVMIVIVVRVNNRFAMERAAVVIQACEAYKQERGTYPTLLADLVPEYGANIPLAKLSFGFNRFVYLRTDRGYHLLLYMEIPPTRMRAYVFEAGRWITYRGRTPMPRAAAPLEVPLPESKPEESEAAP